MVKVLRKQWTESESPLRTQFPVRTPVRFIVEMKARVLRDEKGVLGVRFSAG